MIIDGYNVIGVQHRDREKAREEFIDLLIRYRNLSGHDITVVFDGHKAGPGFESTSVRGGVRTVYSGLGERADDVIKRLVSRNAGEWIVVTSDRDIANHAWSVNSIPVPSDRFLDIVSMRAGKTGRPEGPAQTPEGLKDEQEEAFKDRMGNPRQMSKKDKALLRALNKL